MPELPDVEAIRRYLLAEGLAESRITGVTLGWPRAVQGVSPEEFSRDLPGRVFLDVQRRAKYLLLPLDRGTLVVHLRMTGSLELVEASAGPLSKPSAVFGLSGHRELRFYDPRRLGKLWLLDDPAPLLAALGPEPLEPSFTIAVLEERLARRRTPIKPLLLEQDVIAGIGNIYADEILFCAKLHPTRIASTLTARELERLHGCTVSVLERATELLSPMIPLGGPPTESAEGRKLLRMPREAESPCTQCRTPVRRLVLRGRSAYFCPSCQPES